MTDSHYPNIIVILRGNMIKQKNANVTLTLAFYMLKLKIS